jgi:hypothetical protein
LQLLQYGAILSENMALCAHSPPGPAVAGVFVSGDSMATKRTFPPYDPEAGKRLFAGMDAGLAVRNICLGDGMPDMETFKHWRKKSPEFAAGYAAAVERKRERQP